MYRWQSLSAAMQTTEMEAMLREVYGESFVNSSAATLTMKRVKGEPRQTHRLMLKRIDQTAFMFEEHDDDSSDT